MKKSILIIIISLLTILFIFIIINMNGNKELRYSSNYTAERTSRSNYNTSSSERSSESLENISNKSDTDEKDKENTKKEESEKNEKKDEDSENVSNFSTKLPKDTKARYSNIDLACKTLNDTIVKSGDTFSLWNTLGCPTKEKGYKKAKAFTSSGKIKYSYGGGICQVSTTIYNALLKLDGIEILERHEHSRDVVYIKDGKDAAVSYKSADLRFKNNLEYDIRLKADVKNNKVVIEIEKA